MSRVVAAVDRALDARQREALEEVEKILAAALGVIEQAAPAPPKVSDIVATPPTPRTLPSTATSPARTNCCSPSWSAGSP
jgi:hypothetical protein